MKIMNQNIRKEKTMISFTCRLMFLALIILLAGTATLSATETILEEPAYRSGKVTMILAASPLKTMTEIPFAINVSSDTGAEITDAALSISMDMPAMPMPPNKPATVWSEDAYRGVAIFTMAGEWQISVDIQRPDHAPEHVVFTIDQVMMK